EPLVTSFRASEEGRRPGAMNDVLTRLLMSTRSEAESKPLQRDDSMPYCGSIIAWGTPAANGFDLYPIPANDLRPHLFRSGAPSQPTWKIAPRGSSVLIPMYFLPVLFIFD